MSKEIRKLTDEDIRKIQTADTFAELHQIPRWKLDLYFKQMRRNPLGDFNPADVPF